MYGSVTTGFVGANGKRAPYRLDPPVPSGFNGTICTTPNRHPCLFPVPPPPPQRPGAGPEGQGRSRRERDARFAGAGTA
ncbi:hypothetical protein GCM10018952_31250 [Streptosporangium vulgare]